MLKPGGRMAFYTIFIPSTLPEEMRRRVQREAPGQGEAYSRASQPSLLRSAGFVNAEERDVTEEYLRTARAWYEARARRGDVLRKLQGDEIFESQQANRAKNIRAIEQGWLKRSLFIAARPERGGGAGADG